MGKEIIEIRYETGRRFAGMFGWKEYPAKTKTGMTDGLLTLPFEFILPHNLLGNVFAFENKRSGFNR
ncbi:type IV secretory pathway VirB4 component [Bartonella heixiaziensis]